MGEVTTQERQGQSMIPAPAPREALVSGGRPAALNPRNLPEAMQLAEMIALSGMTPKAYGDSPAKVLVGIMAGAEVGLAPFQALQSIAVINGNPAIWGDGALALVLGSGLLADMREDDDGQTATCTMVRKGRETAIVRTFSMEDAKKAGLAGKVGPWTQYPKRMRQMRARLFAIRDGFADVLKGLSIAEEVQDYDETERVASPSVKIADLRQQAGRPAAVVETDASLDDDAQFLRGKVVNEAVKDAIDDGVISGTAEATQEVLQEGRSDEQHGDQHDGSDDAQAGGEDLSPSEVRTRTLVAACERAKKAEHIAYVTDQVAKHEAGLELDQIGRLETAIKAARKRLNLTA